MSELSSYELNGSVAKITLDDGKVNALSTGMTSGLIQQLDQAESDGAVVLMTGTQTTFSAGFDLRCDQKDWPAMMVSGGKLARRMLSFPHPVVIACNGNAIAMGALLLNAADYRIGVPGQFRIGLNEVALGMTLPWFAIELARHRLSRRYFDLCTVTGTMLDPDEAKDAGFLDQLESADSLFEAGLAKANELAGIDMAAHLATKLRVREQVLLGLEEGLERLTGPDPDW
ncbi:MAG: crotonase/enoyl-CoA hydratase family protein [Solirubrobacterales bacterium]